MCAIESGNLEIFELILKQSQTDVNLKDSKTQKNALELALLDMNRLEMAHDLVLQKGADLNLTDSKSLLKILIYIFKITIFRSNTFS